MYYFNNISYLISHIFLMLFFYLFTVHRYSSKKTIGICLFTFSVLSSTDCLKLNFFPDSGLCYISVTIFQIIIVQSTNIYISSKRNTKVLFMGLCASNYVIAGAIAASILYIRTGNPILALIGSCMVHAVILFILYLKIRKEWFQCYTRDPINSWWELCLIPVFFYCSFCFTAFFPNTLYDIPDNILGCIILLITMFTSYIIVLRYVESEVKRSEIYWKNMLFETYIKGLENQYYLVEQSENNLKVLRHDIRHYSMMIHSLLDAQNYDEIRKIAIHIGDVVDENKITKYCYHLITNMIFSDVIKQAHSRGIEIILDAQVEKEIPVNDYEFATVIANLFENAMICVNALKIKKRYINAKIHCTQAYLLIDMKNEYEKEIIFDPATGLPVSQKGHNHGFGMQSVLSFSNKIDGNIGCYCENGIFHFILYAKF